MVSVTLNCNTKLLFKCREPLRGSHINSTALRLRSQSFTKRTFYQGATTLRLQKLNQKTDS